jgi:hypothetical protein
MLLDEFLPAYDVVSRYGIDVAASAERTFAAAREVDLGESRLVRTLFTLRELPQRLVGTRRAEQVHFGVTLAGLEEMGFVRLAERPGQEMVFGLVGRFWRPTAGLLRVDVEGFRSFTQPGYARAAWNIAVEPRGPEAARVTTETRVQCTDASSRRVFKAYWALIGPFSGLIRGALLSAIRSSAESPL